MLIPFSIEVKMLTEGWGSYLTLVTHVITIPYDKKLEAQGSERAVSLGQ
jgi:hypothetical protein